MEDIHKLTVSPHGDALRSLSFSEAVPPNKNKATFAHAKGGHPIDLVYQLEVEGVSINLFCSKDFISSLLLWEWKTWKNFSIDTFQTMYILDSYVALVPGKRGYNQNHYIANKHYNQIWLMFDDSRVYKAGLNDQMCVN